MIEWKPETADEIISNFQSHIKDFCNRKMPNRLPELLMDKKTYELLLKIDKETKEFAKRNIKKND